MCLSHISLYIPSIRQFACQLYELGVLFSHARGLSSTPRNDQRIRRASRDSFAFSRAFAYWVFVLFLRLVLSCAVLFHVCFGTTCWGPFVSTTRAWRPAMTANGQCYWGQLPFARGPPNGAVNLILHISVQKGVYLLVWLLIATFLADLPLVALVPFIYLGVWLWKKRPRCF